MTVNEREDVCLLMLNIFMQGFEKTCMIFGLEKISFLFLGNNATLSLKFLSLRVLVIVVWRKRWDENNKGIR